MAYQIPCTLPQNNDAPPILNNLKGPQRQAITLGKATLLITAIHSYRKTHVITHLAAHLILKRSIPGHRIL